MKKEQKIFNNNGGIRRPVEEIALNRIIYEEKQRRHDLNLRQFTGFWHGRYYIKGKPQR